MVRDTDLVFSKWQRCSKCFICTGSKAPVGSLQGRGAQVERFGGLFHSGIPNHVRSQDKESLTPQTASQGHESKERRCLYVLAEPVVSSENNEALQ